MSQCVVPNWDVKQDHHEGGGEDQNNKISSSHHHHHHHHQNNNLIACATTTGAHHLVPMSTNYEVQELTWENGQLAMHGLSGLLNSGPTTKPTWGRAGDTLESIVHQATCHNQPHDHHQRTPAAGHIASTDTSTVPSSERKWMADDHHHQHQQLMKKRPSSDHSIRNDQDDHQQQILMDGSGCASANATFCRNNNNNNNNTSVTRTWASNSMDSLKKKKGDEDSMGNYNDITMMTWPSFESPSSFKTKATDDDSIFHCGSENQDEDGETKAETLRSHSSRRIRAAAVHNQSERRRRDRINQKMKSLQKLVPNASKTDKASMLDEVIEYLKQLQAQIQMMANMRNLNFAQMMGMQHQQQQQQQQQQQLQMSLLSRMGMGAVGLGMGMGMLHPQSLPPHHLHPPVPLPPFVPPPPFMMPPSFVPPTHAPAPPSPETTGRNNGAVPMVDPYSAFLAQSMNMDLYNKMVAVYRQHQVTQSTQATGCPSKSNLVRGG